MHMDSNEARKKLVNLENEFWTAANLGDVYKMKLCLNQGVNVNTVGGDYELSALDNACLNGDLEAVSVLVKNGVTINRQRPSGITPLFFASQNGYSDIVRLLTYSGADVNLVEKESGSSALDAACFSGHLEVVSELVRSGAHVNNQRKNGFTPLYIAAQKGHFNIANFLIYNGADVNLYTEQRCTPLYTASQKCHLKIVNLLIQNGADFNLVTKKLGQSALDAACFEGHLEVVKLLVTSGADVNKQRLDGCTSLFIAAEKGHLNIVQFLINSGADINLANKTGYKPVDIARIKYNQPIVMLLEKVKEGNIKLPEFKLSGCDSSRKKCPESIFLNRFECAQFEDNFLKEKDLMAFDSVVIDTPDKLYRGILKWSGIVDETLKCVGVELSENIPGGTSGLFTGNKLFDCQERSGILVNINYVTRDTTSTSGWKSTSDNHHPVASVSKVPDNESANALSKLSIKPKSDVRSQKDFASKVEISRWSPHENLSRIVVSKFKRMRQDNSFLAEEGLTVNQHVLIKIGSQCWSGELKWCGLLDYVVCAGIELASKVEFGSNGIYNGIIVFKSDSRKGVFVPLTHVKSDPSYRKISEVMRSTVNLPECRVCMDAVCATVLDPCGHICVCETCSVKLENCPICQTRILKTLKAFVA